MTRPLPRRAPASPADQVAEIAFGPFRLIASRQLLLDGNGAVPLGGRAIEILAVLADRAGELVSKQELIARVWPGESVDERPLRVHISSLRKALGGGVSIENVPGCGYRFIAPVRRVGDAGPVVRRHGSDATFVSRRGGDATATGLIGRDDTLCNLEERLATERLLTVVGPGGMGKTRVATELMARLGGRHRDGAHFVDLAPLADPRLVPGALAAGLGLPPSDTDAGLAARLAARQAMLVLDNCEHVITAAGRLAAAIHQAAPGMLILATSREPLGVAGEVLARLPPLGLPPASARLAAATAAAYPAIRLFTERAAATLGGFTLSDADAPVVADICRRLDGMPLAIELAAARIDVLGLRGIAERMEAGGAASFTGRRTARPRQQTLRALLDWSYGLLPETERRILRRLAVFSGGFTADAAVAVAGDADQPPSVVIDAISRLVAKSLVVGDVAEVGPRWKLLETTRLHALERLAAEGERDDAAQRHAEFFRDFLTRFAGASHAATDQTATWQREIHNIRAALDATLTQGGDTALGVVLTAACVPVWTRLSLMAECRDRIERALARLAQDTSGPESSGPHARLEERLRLQLALGVALIYTTGLAARTEDVLDGALRLAERLGDVDFQLRAHWAIWTFNSTVGVYRQAADAARRFAVAAGRSADPADALIGDRLLGNVLHFMGNQTAARHLLDRVVGSPAAAGGRHTMLFDVDQHVVARAIRARVLWLQGLLDEAWQEAQQSLQQARALRQALAVCYGLIEAVCPIALALGKPAEAERAIADLEETVTRHGLTFWAAQARCLRGSLLVAQGRFEAASALLQAELRVFPGRARHYSGFPGDLAQAQAGIGDIAGALATLDQALLRFDRDGVSWCAADALRLKGELLRRGDGGVRAIAAAERCLVAAIDTARRQGALFWELRAATSLARLLAGSGDRDAARTTLAPVAARFTQGLAMPDMVAAAALLRDLDAGETASL